MDEQLIWLLLLLLQRWKYFLDAAFPLLCLSFFSLMLSDWVLRLSNKLHKGCSFAHVVSWGSRLHFMLCGFSGNKQVSRVHVCIVFLQLGCNFDPVIPLWGRQNSQLGDMTSLFLGPKPVCMCVSVYDYNVILLRTVLSCGHDVFKMYSSRFNMCKYHCLSACLRECN